jgi:hypothetical protein
VTILPRLKAISILLALVLAPLAVLLADPGRLAAWQMGTPAPASWSEIEQTAEGLERGWDAYEARSQINQDLVAGLAVGRFTLAQATDLYWATNRDVQGFRDLIGRTWTDDPEECARLNLLRLVRTHLQGDPTRAEVMDRLIAEYERTYGPFPLAGAEELDRW